MQPSSPDKQPNSAQGLDHLQFVCFFLIAFPGYLFATRPHPNLASLIFRLSFILVGVIGLLVLQVLKARKR